MLGLPKNSFLRLLLFGISATLPMFACSLGWEKNAVEMAKSIPVHPDSEFINEFVTSYPSSSPGAGIIYEASADRQELLDFYLEQMEQEGWEILSVDADSPYKSVPYIISAQNEKWLCQVIITSSTHSQITINLIPR